MSSHTSLVDHYKRIKFAESMSIEIFGLKTFGSYGVIVLSCIVSCVCISEQNVCVLCINERGDHVVFETVHVFSVGARLVTVAGVCCHLSASVILAYAT